MPPPKKILVIDDDKTIHALLKLHLEKAGFQVFAALDTVQGMMLAKQLKPDLIVLDLLMPAGGGFVVYDRLRMMSGTFQTLFLIYSSLPPAQVMAHIHEGPTVRILHKEAKIEAVVAAATQLIADNT